MNTQNLSHDEKLEQLRQNINTLFGSRDISRDTQTVLQGTINSLLADLLKEEVVEMKKVGFLKWVQTNPTMAVIVFILVSFGSGISVSGAVTPIYHMLKAFVF